jgi:hypothetical protein
LQRRARFSILNSKSSKVRKPRLQQRFAISRFITSNPTRPERRTADGRDRTFAALEPRSDLIEHDLLL